MSDDAVDFATGGGPAGADLLQMLEAAARRRASDLHLVAGAPPCLRIDGLIVPLDSRRLTPADTQRLAREAMSEAQHARFEERRQLDFAFSVRGLGRWRANASLQRGAVSLALRRIPDEIPPLETLGLPPIVRQLARRPRGLILVTGPAGGGKSTTLAAMIDLINRERAAHIVTIEDPIEYVHMHRRGLVEQREIGTDATDFASALRNALRQAPDVLMVGELRDPESLATALTIAETGHLTLGTLHTNSAAQAVHRIIDSFPPAQQAQIRSQLSLTLEAVLCQELLARPRGGLAVAVEVLVATPAVRALIREDRVHQVRGMIQAGARHGMQTMEAALADLVRRGAVRLEDALDRAPDPEEVQRLISGAGPEPLRQARASGVR